MKCECGHEKHSRLMPSFTGEGEPLASVCDTEGCSCAKGDPEDIASLRGWTKLKYQDPVDILTRRNN